MKVFYEESHLKVTFDEEDAFIYAKWSGRQSIDDIKRGGRALVTAMLEVSTQFGVVRVLNDNREVVGSWSHSLEWTSKEWFPKMVRAGLKRFAWVLSPDGLAQLTAVRVKLDTGALGSDAVSVFVEIEVARDWLSKPIV